MSDATQWEDLDPIREAIRELERRRRARGESERTLWFQRVSADLKEQGFTMREKAKGEE